VGFREEAACGSALAFAIPAPGEALKRVQQAKAAGCGLLMTDGATDALLDVCDQLGMPVWEKQPALASNHVCVVCRGEEA